jgi:hypothetical protein
LKIIVVNGLTKDERRLVSPSFLDDNLLFIFSASPVKILCIDLTNISIKLEQNHQPELA